MSGQLPSVTGVYDNAAEFPSDLPTYAHHLRRAGYQACQKLCDLARGHDARPWCVTVSFTHPHDPYVARRKYWDLYEDCEHLLPETPAMAYEDHIRRARRAYFANVSYLDDKVGEILHVLESTRQEASA